MDFSFGLGGRSAKERIPLSEALRRYWKHLVPITLLPAVIISVVGLVQQVWAFWAIMPLFYGCGIYASLPYTKKDAPYTFWMVACGLWVLGAIPGILVPPVARGDVFQNATGTRLRILMDQAEFGGKEVELAEITFVPNSDSGEHQHGVTETFYVLEGELEHVVNGKSVKLTAGMVGTVRPPDKVRHKTGPKGARALVIWAPAGEAARLASRWKRVEP
ncbi:MAG: cupin domain-containing protein [Verrucomicrobia bacterium]|nr:cupin domain-containing protein [Verrucomicrobiota bacterium]